MKTQKVKKQNQQGEHVHYVYVVMDQRKLGKYIYGEYEFPAEPIYVGQGYGSRYEWVCYDSTLANSFSVKKRVYEIMKETGWMPMRMKYKLNMTKDESFNLEKKMILTIGRTITNEGPLLNRSLKIGMMGVPWTQEHKDKVSAGNFGKKYSYKTRKQMRDHSHGVPVIWLSRDEEYLGKFNSIKEAADALDLQRANISSCCSGRLKTVGGYKFWYMINKKIF